jgi:hypothetical protein
MISYTYNLLLLKQIWMYNNRPIIHFIQLTILKLMYFKNHSTTLQPKISIWTNEQTHKQINKQGDISD